MKYNILTDTIPQDHRKTVNSKILMAIQLDSAAISNEQIFNAYTGDGGLHGLEFKDYRNYYEYSAAKKEVENGQFYTPAMIASDIVDIVGLASNELIVDPTCGMGVFCNFVPNESVFHGMDICPKSVQVANRLYPDADFTEASLPNNTIENKFDVVLGNPPFSLEWFDTETNTHVRSHALFFKMCAKMLKNGGVVAAIVPTSYLGDEMYYKSQINDLDRMFNFVGQYQLTNDAFGALGVKNYNTKVIYLQKKSEHLKDVPYTNSVSTKSEISKKLALRHNIKSALRLEFNKSLTNDDFGFRVKKYLFEIKQHGEISAKLDSAISYIEKFNTQTKPMGMEDSEWSKKMLTENKVLAYLKRIVKTQNKKAANKTLRVVKHRHGFVVKGKAPKAQKKKYSLSDLVLGTNLIPTKDLDHPYNKLITRKIAENKKITTPFSEMTQSESIAAWLKDFSFLREDTDKLGNKKTVTCKFNNIQAHDLNLFLQKQYSICNWQQGCGKTGGCYAFAKYNQPKVKKTFIVAPSLAIKTTWTEFLNTQGEEYTIITKRSHILNSGSIVLISFNMLIKFKKELQKLVKSLSNKVCLVMDESDEICSNTSKRSRASRDIFRRVKRKFLATGTTTRNNITELYPQLELLFNNSVNMLDSCKMTYVQNKEGDIKSRDNKNHMQPYKARLGFGQFKSCFNPSKATVFGIKKQNQDVFNQDKLVSIIDQSIITRKFKEIAGEKFTVHTEYVNQTADEARIYGVIIREFHRIISEFYGSTGSTRKDAALRIVRQMQLLYKACSTPNSFSDYKGDLPTKFYKIAQLCQKFDEKVAIGCTRKETIKLYVENLTILFPERQIFVITGDVSIDKRQPILDRFEATENGILVCTQQSLKSSVNIPTCDKVIIEGLQWNIPRMEQFYFRFIRYNSVNHTDVHFVSYDGTIEKNILALLMDKEKINEFIKTKDTATLDGVFEEFGIDSTLFDNLMERTEDNDGKKSLSWGTSKIV